MKGGVLIYAECKTRIGLMGEALGEGKVVGP